ncbi:ATP-binding protein [Streptomyces cadmiisoli]|uniref:ATP-binding protein n=1 Tax=Streptomyces cadmiisoli TaxID=2184053 RepID=UPI00364B93D9
MYGNAFADRPGHQVRLALPAESAYAGVARHFGADLLDRWGLVPDLRDSAVLIMGELVANATEHGRSRMSIGLELAERTLRIRVADFGGPRSGRGRHARSAGSFGSGLHIVRTLSQRLRVRRSRNSWRVEAVLRVEKTASASRTT